MIRAATVVSALALAAVVQSCPGGSDCSIEEAPEFSRTEEEITRADVVAVLGEPIGTINSEDRRIDVYEYDGHCSGLNWLFGTFPLPIYYGTEQMLTVEYEADGTFLTAKVWPDTETAEEVIESYEQSSQPNS